MNEENNSFFKKSSVDQVDTKRSHHVTSSNNQHNENLDIKNVIDASFQELFYFPFGVYGFTNKDYVLRPILEIPAEHHYFLLETYDDSYSQSKFSKVKSPQKSSFVVKMITNDKDLLVFLNQDKLDLHIKELGLSKDLIEIGLFTTIHTESKALLFQFDAPILFDYEKKQGYQVILFNK
jgi:flagellar assembly factor FliW